MSHTPSSKCSTFWPEVEADFLKKVHNGQRALLSIRLRVNGTMLGFGLLGMVTYYAYWYFSLMHEQPWLTCIFWIVQLALACNLMWFASELSQDAWRVVMYDLDWEYVTCKTQCRWELWLNICYIAVVLGGIIGFTFALCRPEAVQMQRVMWRTHAIFWSLGVCLDGGVALIFAIVYEQLVSAVWFLPGDVIILVVAVTPRLRHWTQSCLRGLFDSHKSAAAAAGIAGLVGDISVDEAVRRATGRFRTVTLERLTKDSIEDNCPHLEICKLAEFAKLGDSDAFVSHSWHDDPDTKWQALQAWRQRFCLEHGREPSIWFDKCCIDQNNIEEDLLCLPIFLSGCRNLVVLCGTTYLHRLWCIMEIFTFVHMGGDLARVELIPLLSPGKEQEDEATIRKMFDDFDVRKCRCFNNNDKEKMLTIIRTAFGGMSRFNGKVGEIVHKLCSQDNKADGPLQLD